ncbi:MAG: hypothetical protein AABP62_21530 [Planctomycetota bacterium]
MTQTRPIASRLFRPLLACSLSLSLLCLIGAGTGSIKKLTLDTDAPVVELFDGMEQGQVDVRMAMMNPHEGKVFFTNRTDKPLTVAVPKAVVGVHVLPQVGNNAGNGFFGNGGNNNNNQANNGANGQAQSAGGALGAVGNGNGNGNGFPNAPGGMNNNFPGNNFFSIPPEKTVQLDFRSVCLNHGRPNPNAGMKYRLTRVESYTTDPVLQQLLEDYSPRTNKDVQQAAAWHLANGLSWKQLANLTEQRIPGVAVPLFTKTQLDSARELVEQAKQNAAERPTKKDAAPAAVASARRE